MDAKKNKPDWDPRDEDVLKDQISAYDKMRKHCPVAYSDFMQWSVFRHEDVLRIIQEHDTFSNQVSQHLAIPSGMDPPEHTNYRQIINKYFEPDKMNAFEPVCREIVINLVQQALIRGELELMADLSLPFAVSVQCAFLGWPADLQKPLADWTGRNYDATLARDREAMSSISREFQAIVDDMINIRIEKKSNPEEDVMASLMSEEVMGRPLTNEEIASILRTWTVGEIGSIASSIGILVHYLAEHNDLQDKLRSDLKLLPPAIDEILRIHGPLVASRRITKCPVEVNGKKLDEGERISINWVSANRDEDVFEEPDNFQIDRDPSKNLLYGAGIHVCPGAPLARLEMRVVMEELLKKTSQIKLVEGKQPVRARYPASGFSVLPVMIQ